MTTSHIQSGSFNLDPTDVSSGIAALNGIVAAIVRREHLSGKVKSIQWDRDRGIGILVDDDGVREHLANAIGMRPVVHEEINLHRLGRGTARVGFVQGFHVFVWNVEA